MHALVGDEALADADAPGARALDARDAAQERRLARARGAEQNQEGPGLDLEREVVERQVAAEVGLGDVLDDELLSHARQLRSAASRPASSSR